MRLTHAVLVIADISGYTEFITQRTVSLLHAEQVITELLEAMVDRTEHPLILNKFEGDAALLYAESGENAAAAVADVLIQVAALFDAFSTCLAKIRETRAHCTCEACSNVANLRLKAFVHCGEIAIKQIRQFEELAGEEVILIHRLLKNQVVEREYVLLSDAVARLSPAHYLRGRRHAESFDGIGELNLLLLSTEALLL